MKDDPKVVGSGIRRGHIRLGWRWNGSGYEVVRTESVSVVLAHFETEDEAVSRVLGEIDALSK